VFRFIGGTILAAIAAGIARFGPQINAWYGASLGKTAEAGALLAGLSVAADVLALILPSAACALWFERHRAAAVTAWAVWTMTIAITLMASIGFASLNIADTIAARAKIAAESGGLNARIERLRGERAAITETRAFAAIETDIQRAQPAAAAVWRQTAGCTDVTLAASGAACADVLRLRQALAHAQRRDALDAELRAAESRLAALPAVAASDPQTDAAARLINWASFGLTRISAQDIDMARVAGMTLLPQISGLVLMLAMVLWQPVRRRERPSPA
jgi:membrane protein implicated in regulation of membrane protease activity